MKSLTDLNAMKPVRLLGLGLLACILLFGCKKSNDSKEIFKDDFNRADGSLGSKYFIYYPFGTTFTISSNRAWPQAVTGGLPAALYSEKLGGAYKMTAKFLINGADFDGDAFIVAKSTAAGNPTNSYVCGYRYVSGTDPEVHEFTLAKYVNGSRTIFASTGMHTLTSGTSDTITFTIDGSSLKCEMSGTTNVSISLKDSTYGDGYGGLMGGMSGGQNHNFVFFDDFSIERL